MAVARTGSVGKFGSGDNSNSTSVSVPTDAELMVVTVSGYHDTEDYMSDGSLTLNGDSFTVSAHYDDRPGGIDNQKAVIFTLQDPDTGTQTLAWDWTTATDPMEGLNFFYAFYKGVDDTTPIKDSGGSNLNTADEKTTGSMTAASGDMAVAVADMYTGNTPQWSENVTVRETQTTNGDYAEYVEASPSGNIEITMQSDGEGPWASYNVLAAIVIGASAGGTAYTQALSGALSFTGAIKKQAQISPDGALGMTGGVVRQTQISKAGALGFSGLVSKEVQISKAGELGMVGSIDTASVYLQDAAGELDMTGALTPAAIFGASLAGALDMAGSVVKAVGKALQGAVGFSGAATKQTSKSMSGGLSMTGEADPAGVFLKGVAGEFDFAGDLTETLIPLSSEADTPKGLDNLWAVLRGKRGRR